jgi:hypothetical protein
MHEIMVSDEEANHCVKRGKYFAILPMLPELGASGRRERPALARELSSADNVVDFRRTVDLLKRNRLMVEDVSATDEKEEMLR